MFATEFARQAPRASAPEFAPHSHGAAIAAPRPAHTVSRHTKRAVETALAIVGNVICFPTAIRLRTFKWCAFGLMLVTAGCILGVQLSRPSKAMLTLAPTSARIESFSAGATRVVLGQSTQLCYVATGANRLRMNPRIGDLLLLNDCRRVTFSNVGRHEFTLSAIGRNGRVIVRRAEVDVVAASVAAHTPGVSLCTLVPCATVSTPFAHTVRPWVERAISERERQFRPENVAVQLLRSQHIADLALSGLDQSISNAAQHVVSGISSLRHARIDFQ